jgi:hypothetical protein
MRNTRRRQLADPVLSHADASEAHDVAPDRDSVGVLRQLQMACDDLYCKPLDPEAQEHVRELLLRSTPALRELRVHARHIKVACDELHDDPTNLDAQHTLLSLLDNPA